MNLRPECVTRTGRGPQVSHTVPAGRGKRSAPQLAESTREGTPQIIRGGRMAPRKAGAPPTQQRLDSRPWCALTQQFLSDPLVGDAPVWLRESLWNPQPVQPGLIDFAGSGWLPDRGRQVSDRRIGGWRAGGVTGYLAPSCFDQRSCPASQTQLGQHQTHPRSSTIALAPQGLLVGETSQPSQMAPIGAGQVGPIQSGQLLGDSTGDGRFQGIGTDSNPGLQVAETGLEHDTGRMPMGPHQVQSRRTTMVQIQQDIASATRPGIGLDIDIAALAVARAQKSYGRFTNQLGGRPQPLSGKRSPGSLVNQPNQIQVVGHGGELAADCLPREKESVIEHNAFAGETTRRIMHLWCARVGARVKTVSGNSRCCISRLSQKRAQSS